MRAIAIQGVWRYRNSKWLDDESNHPDPGGTLTTTIPLQHVFPRPCYQCYRIDSAHPKPTNSIGNLVISVSKLYLRSAVPNRSCRSNWHIFGHPLGYPQQTVKDRCCDTGASEALPGYHPEGAIGHI